MKILHRDEVYDLECAETLEPVPCHRRQALELRHSRTPEKLLYRQEWPVVVSLDDVARLVAQAFLDGQAAGQARGLARTVGPEEIP